MNFDVTPLFAVPLYYSKNGIDLLNGNLLCIDTLEFIKTKTKTNSVSKDTNVLAKPEFQQYKDICEMHLKQFVDTVLQSTQTFYITNSWIAKSDPGEEHSIHHHPNSIISGVLYLQSSEDCGKINFHHKSPFKHEFSFNYDLKNYNQFNSDMWSYSPLTGDMIIFPSWLRHSVNKNQSNSSRIILGFNAFVKGTFGSNEYAADLTL